MIIKKKRICKSCGTTCFGFRCRKCFSKGRTYSLGAYDSRIRKTRRDKSKTINL